MTSNIYAQHKVAGGQSGDLLKPEIGKAYKLRIVGEAVVYQSDFEGKLSTRYALPVWNFTDNKAQILQLPASTFSEIVDLANSEWGDPTKFNIVYKKTGTGLETRHSLQPAAGKEEPSADQMNAVEAIDVKGILSKFPSVTHVLYISEAENTTPPAAVTDAFEGIDVL